MVLVMTLLRMQKVFFKSEEEQLFHTAQNNLGARFIQIGVVAMRYAVSLEAGDTTISSSGFTITVVDLSIVNLGEAKVAIRLVRT